ncbi:HAMP domain-containing histidine kinase [Sutcliffiella horikoshii]|uniref:sensor histidine kinase n=1 Tax=Sutcliffiella horikoshii TaxID=79883 RepID=UPI00384B215E
MNKIFYKLFFIYALIISSLFIIFGLIFLYLFHVDLYEDFEETYTHQQQQITELLTARKEFGWTEEETMVAIEPTLVEKDFHVYLFDVDGERIFKNGSFEHEEIDKGLLEKAKSGEYVAKGGWTNGDLSYVIASPIERELTMVMIFHDLSHAYQQVLYMILLTFAITIAIAGIIIWFLSAKITAPLRDMNEIALKYAKGDFSQSVQIASKDEIGQLGESFNHMAAELNSLEETRKDFIANVSHDLRTPLTSIKGFLIALLDDTIPANQRKEFYLLMKDETERVIKLVNDTLDMSQLEAGQVTLRPTSYNLTKQLQLIAVKLEPHLANKKLEIQLIPDNQEIMVVADRDRIEQALINLLQNAIQVSSTHQDIQVFLEKEEEEVVIRILDHGEGISEENLRRIWERFYKTDKARSGKTGIGIGLSIVKSIMDLHGTTIKVESKVGEGTVFSFALPLMKQESDHER